jgi:ABC-type transporter MlaC component
MLGRRTFLCVAVVAAASLFQIAPAGAVDQNAAIALINQAVADALKTFSGTHTQAEKRRLAETLIARYTDLRVLAATILGRYWTAAAPADQSKFTALLVDYALSGWASQVSDVSGGDTIKVTGTQPAGTAIIVHSVAISPGQAPTPIDWTVGPAADGHLIIRDASVDHVSFITTMHDDFTSYLNNNGGRLETLMAAMQRKIDANIAAK